MKQISPITFLWLLLIACGSGGARAASIAEPAGDEIASSPGAPRYDIGTPTLVDLWVDPANGGDGNSGATRALSPTRQVRTSARRRWLAAGIFR